MKHLMVIFAFLCMSTSFLMEGQTNTPSYHSEHYVIKGTVRFKRSLKPLEDVGILVNGGKYTESDSRGNFTINARKGDELVLRHPNMQTVYHTILSNDRIIIEVEEVDSNEIATTLAGNKDSFDKLMDSVKVYMKKDVERSINFVADALQESNSKSQNAEAYEILADVYVYWKQYDLAISNYKISLQNLDKESVKVKLGKSYAQLKNYNKALEIFTSVDKKKLSTYDNVESIEALGDVYLLQQNFDEAIKRYKEALALSENYNIIEKITNLNSKIAEAYNQKGSKSEARTYFNEALISSTKEPIERSISQLINVAEFQNKNKEYADEIKLRKLAIEDIRAIRLDSMIDNESPLTLQKQNYKIGTAYYLNNDNANAIPFLEESIKEAEKKEDLVVKKDAIKKLSDVYVDEGDYKKALETFKEYTDAVDELYIKREQEISQAAIINRKIAENQNRINSLELDKQLTATTIQVSEERGKRQQYIIYSLVVGLILVLILTYVLFKYIRQQRLANNLLALKSLRSQMNPHFIFNALNSVNSFIALNDERAANKYLSDFSLLMREVLENSQEDVIPLEKEIQLLEIYTKLEHFRFKDKFDYDIEIDNSIDIPSYTIPPMLLQPYIENAVWHGLRYRESKGYLKISIKNMARDYISITIADNGIGRKASQALKTENQKKHSPQGLSNIADRINILNTMYKDKITVEIRDGFEDEDQGTTVNVILKK